MADRVEGRNAAEGDVPPVHPACAEEHSITDTMLVNGLPSGAQEVTVTLPNLGCCLADAQARAGGGDFAVVGGVLCKVEGAYQSVRSKPGWEAVLRPVRPAEGTPS